MNGNDKQEEATSFLQQKKISRASWMLRRWQNGDSVIIKMWWNLASGDELTWWTDYLLETYSVLFCYNHHYYAKTKLSLNDWNNLESTQQFSVQSLAL